MQLHTITNHTWSAELMAKDAYAVMEQLSMKVEDPRRQPMALACLMVAMCKQMDVSPTELLNYADNFVSERHVNEERLVFQALFDFIANELHTKLI